MPEFVVYDPMRSRSSQKFGPHSFVLSLGALAILPLLPELLLQLQGQWDFKGLAPVIYYQCIISFVVLSPAMFLLRILARFWVVFTACLFSIPTLIVGYYAVTHHARWNLTAHTALLQSNLIEARGYVDAFASAAGVAWLVVAAVGYVVLIYVNLQSARPQLRTALAILLAGLAVSAYGIRNAITYGRSLTRETATASSLTPRVTGVGVNMFHPFTLFVVTHANYLATHQYYLQQFQQARAHDLELSGATPIPGAICPRILVVVIGESANRRHWSLYGYSRPTTPRLAQIGPELFVFRDVISTSVGTLSSIRGMLTTSADAVPIFRLFAAAGYTTHWLSAQYNQGFNDLEMNALVGTCDERVFLSAAYDENLIPFMKRAVSRPGAQLIFLNLMGSHVNYRDRFPAAYAIFKGETADERLKANYDNSIRYTDHVLAEAIQSLRDLHEPSCLLYVSDHGEDVFDSRPDKYMFRDDVNATDPMYEVPFVVWFSPEYVSANSEFVRHAVADATSHPFQNTALYHGLIALARLQHPLYDSRADVFSPAFEAKERRVGVMQRVYSRNE